MPFTNKEIQLSEFIEQLHQRIKEGGNDDVRIFFECFLQERLIKEVKSSPGLNPDWGGQVNAGDFDVIYPMAANILHDAASSNFSEAHRDIYEHANAVSVAFCDELNEMLQCSGEEIFNLIPIISYVDMMVEAGAVEVKNGFVKLTPEGEAMA